MRARDAVGRRALRLPLGLPVLLPDGESEDNAYGVLDLPSDEEKFVSGAELVTEGDYTAQ